MTRFKHAFKFILFLLVLSGVLFCVGRIVEYKSSRAAKEPYYSTDFDIDVLLAGSSHMHNGIDPLTLYNEYGITAFNAGSAGEEVEVTYYVVKELLKEKKPKILVVDMFQVHAREEGFDEDPGFIHGSMDFMPIGRNRIELAYRAAKAQGTGMLDYLSNVYAYHTRWKELTSEDFIFEKNYQMGGELLYGMNPPKEIPEFFPDDYDEEKLKGIGYESMCKIMDLCDENGIKCVFVNVPYSKTKQERQVGENTMMRAAKEKGAYIFNTNQMAPEELGINYDMDYRDAAGHFNIIGEQRFSKVFGAYLKELGAGDHRQDAEVASYYDSIQTAYSYQKIEKAKSASGVLEFAMYAFEMDGWNVCLYTQNGQFSRENSRLTNLVNYMSIPCRSFETMEDTIKSEVSGQIDAELLEEDFEKEGNDVLYAVITGENGEVLGTGRFVRSADGSYRVEE